MFLIEIESATKKPYIILDYIIAAYPNRFFTSIVADDQSDSDAVPVKSAKPATGSM